MATTVLALLDEPDYALKEYALHTLDSRVNELWPEIADHIPVIEELHEDHAFPAKSLAALVVAKVYYNLGDLDLALKYALAAGSELDLSARSEFVDTIISHSIKTYIEKRQADNGETTEPTLTTLDEHLTKVVEEMLERCVAGGQVTLALGVALEARRLDLVEAQLQSAHDPETLSFVLDSAITLVPHRAFRTKVLRALAKVVDAAVHMSGDYGQYCGLATKLAVQLDDAELATHFLDECEPTELALQAAFDLVGAASSELLAKTALHFSDSAKARHARLVRVLSGIPTCDFSVTFLEKHYHADLNVLQATKAALDARNSIFHSALSFQNALLHLGTTKDGFFRSNIDWLGKATHWTKFTATAALGVIHQGNLTQGRRILQPYLSKAGSDAGHIKGGAFYGLGLVFAGFGAEVLPFLREQITEQLNSSGEQGGEGSLSAEEDVLVHGACLGVALAGMQTQQSELYSVLRETLYCDVTVAGEAAGLAMGLVMLGSKDKSAEEEMLQYSRSTAHEKIIRSLALGLALLNYGKEEAADELVAELFGDHDAHLRYGGCFTIALAYAGTSNARAARKLLHVAVSDASDDVRRAAMMALGFLYIRNPTALPRMVELLSESHNPHVRYGSAIALGVACSGSGLPAAVEVLEPMLQDPVDFVRQGAMIALALVLVQHTEQSHPRAKSVREHFAKVVRTKNEDGLAKFGAALAQGIIDGGGCNATVALENCSTGSLNVRAITGLAVFLQYWYWFPVAYFISLAYTPTAAVCVSSDLRIPEFDLECEGAPARRFAYPPKLEEPSAKAPEQVVTAILSTTLKESRRRTQSAKEKEKEREKKEAEEKEKQVQEEEQKKQTEAANRGEFAVPNMSRVVPWQRKHMRFLANSPFTPAADHREVSGVLVVNIREGAEDVKYIKTQRQSHAVDDEQQEAPLPRPFVVPVETEEE